MGSPMTEVAVAEAKLRDAKRVAMYAYTSRAENLHLIRAKQTGRILAINNHAKMLDATRKELQTLEHDSKYGNIHSYVTDKRVDDFLAHMILKHEIDKKTARIAQLEQTNDSVQEIWDAQVKHLEPHHVATLAVLNYASGSIEESFPIDPERCKCGRIFHFNATLCMNFCTVHKIYFPVLSADDKSTRKAKQSPGNNTNNSNNVRHSGKTHRFIITSNNQICAANNMLYKAQLQHSQDRVVKVTNELRVKLVQKEQSKKIVVQKQPKPPKPPKPPRPPPAPKKTPEPKKKTKLKTNTESKPKKPPKEPKKPKPPKEPKKPKPPKEPKKPKLPKKKQTTIQNTLAKQRQLQTKTLKTLISCIPQTKEAPKSKTPHLDGTTPPHLDLTTTITPPHLDIPTQLDVILHPQPRPKKQPPIIANTKRKQTQELSETSTQLQPVSKKQQLQVHKNTSNYECYLLQFAPDAPEITSTMLQQIHAVVSTIAIFGEVRCLQEINTLLDTSSAFREVRSHAQRILKLSRAQPVPIIPTELRQRLIARFREIQVVLSTWQQAGGDADASTKSRRRFAPCNESLTHVFLLGEKQWHLASAFAAHSTLKVELDHVQRFRDLIQTVARTSTFVWKHDFDLVVDTNNHRTPP